MAGETDLAKMLRTLEPVRNKGEFVFCRVESLSELLGKVEGEQILFFFNEKEGCTIVLEKSLADTYKLPYTYAAAWITLAVHSSLEAVGLTAAFSEALAKKGVSCNVVAATFHDHIFVSLKEADKAMKILRDLSSGN